MEAAAPPPTPASEAPPAAKTRYPPGYRFKPTESELILYYLQKKVNNEPIPISDIKDIYLKEHSPKALTEAFPKIGDNEWYFFTPRDRKYPNGTRPDRAADTGYWKATGADNRVEFEGRLIGFKKALVFYEGRPQQGQQHKTSWIMHEFRLNQSPRPRNERNPRDMRLDDWVLCKIYEKKPNSKRKRGNRKGHLEEDVTLTTGTSHHHQENVVGNDQPPLIHNHDANVNPAVQDQGHYYHHPPSHYQDCFHQQDLLQISAPPHHQELQLQHHQDLLPPHHHQELQLPYGDGDDVVFDESGVDQLEINALIGNNNNDHNIYLNEQDQEFGFNGGGGGAWINNENCFVPSSNMKLGFNGGGNNENCFVPSSNMKQKQLQSFSWINNNNEASYSAFLSSNTNNINYHNNFGVEGKKRTKV
ncbi:NAC-like [Perilla frutescens var. hirtella]|uniref:NAC-like n=1 Tax=Perilla frutescens var. hirtella TaxID=608512 RepID=A0AAD4JI24_PERFH|nr:NAC-like [Perilla frutescens var. hirtella]